MKQQEKLEGKKGKEQQRTPQREATAAPLWKQDPTPARNQALQLHVTTVRQWMAEEGRWQQQMWKEMLGLR
jgi:hypothetical protein